jgi:hypothetical protein
LREIYFVFFFPPAKKEERNPTHIAAHLQAPRADAQNQRLQKSCNFAYAPLQNSNIFYIEKRDIKLTLAISIQK